MTTTSPTAQVSARAEPSTAVDVSCRDLVKRYPDGTVALDDVSISCPAGGITVLLGPSGCGKTTLLRCVAGLETPTAGAVLIGGRDVSAVDAGLRGVAMVFQNYALYPDKTAEGNLAFPLRMARVPRRERARRVAAIAELLQIDGLLKRRPAELSGGQRQRVGIGRALIREPTSCSWMSPSPASTPSCASRCGRSSWRCSAGSA